MYNQSNLRRDIATTIAFFVVSIVAVAGGAMTSKPPETTSGPINAGATIESEPTKDQFARAANEPMETPGRPHHQQDKQEDVESQSDKTSEPNSQESASDDSAPLLTDTSGDGVKPENADDTTLDELEPSESTLASAKPATTIVTPKPAVPEPINPVEKREAPLDQLTSEQIKERLGQYRAWVHQGDLSIDLDMPMLSADQVMMLVDFYVLSTDTTKLRISTDGRPTLLKEEPPGRLIADLPLMVHWPAFVRHIASEWFGAGPIDKNLAIVLNERAELHLYRILVNGLRGKHPESGGKVVIGIRAAGDGGLDFVVQKLTPKTGVERRLL